MDARIDLNCKQCHGLVTSVFEISDEARISWWRFKDIFQGTAVSMACNSCGSAYDAYVVEDNFCLLAHVPGVDEEKYTVAHLKPDFLKSFSYELKDASSVFRHLITTVEDSCELLNSFRSTKSRIQDTFLRMLFVQLVTSLETYLQDTLTTEVIFNKESMRELLSNERILSEERIPLLTAYIDPYAVRSRVEQYLGSVLYHNLPKVNALFRIVFKFSLPYVDEEHKSYLHKAIQYRHDCVHRNGRTDQGDYITISEDYLNHISKDILRLVCRLEENLIIFRQTRPTPKNDEFDDDIPF